MKSQAISTISHVNFFQSKFYFSVAIFPRRILFSWKKDKITFFQAQKVLLSFPLSIAGSGPIASRPQLVLPWQQRANLFFTPSIRSLLRAKKLRLYTRVYTLRNRLFRFAFPRYPLCTCWSVIVAPIIPVLSQIFTINKKTETAVRVSIICQRCRLRFRYQTSYILGSKPIFLEFFLYYYVIFSELEWLVVFLVYTTRNYRVGCPFLSAYHRSK